MAWWLLDNTIIAAVLALIVALLCRVRRVPPVVRHALWLVVLIKLIVPPLFPGTIKIPVHWRSLAGRLSATDAALTDRRSGILPLRDMAAARPPRFQSPAPGRQAFEPPGHETGPADEFGDEIGKAMHRDARDAAGCRVYDDGAFRSTEEQLHTAAALPEAGAARAENRLSSAIEAESPDAAGIANEPPPPPASQRANGSQPMSVANFLIAGFIAATCIVIGIQIV